MLEIRHLTTELVLRDGPVPAVRDVSLMVAAGETLGLLGESGCGKSLTALSVMRLLPPGGQVTSGEVRLGDRELLSLSETEMCRLRGRELGMVFQDPMSSLNPAFRVGAQVAEPLRLHRGHSRASAWARAVELLAQVGIPSPQERANAYPHELSGGTRQRVMMAMALAAEPQVLLADEPTTALDVTVQAQLLALLKSLQQARGLALLLITHDLGVVAQTCDRVAVMYAGRVVETSAVGPLFAAPVHPYTAGLLRSLPSRRQEGQVALYAIPGVVPSLGARPSGCAFRNRCERATEVCARVDPPLEEKRTGQSAACHHPRPVAAP